MAGDTPHQETEVKLSVGSLERVRERLVDLGAELTSPRSFETNILYDHPDRRLHRSDRALRLRSVGARALVTFKGPATWTLGMRTREEIELEVAEVGVMGTILCRVGLEPAFRYEKWRESWRLEDVVVALDETPLGSFVEIEGPPHRLSDTTRALDLDPAEAVRGSYPSLWEDHRRRHQALDLPPDMVFGRR